MMKKDWPQTIIASAIILIYLFSCGKSTPTEDIFGIIETTENKLHHAESLGEISRIQFHLLDSITECFDSKYDGYRYNENEDDYKELMKRFERYNIIYCRGLSRFNPELNTESGNRDKVVQVLALMKRMEHQALTAPKGIRSEGTNDIPALDDNNSEYSKEEQCIYPTMGEIDSVNAKLPVMVSEGTLFTKVEYNDKTKVQTFYYRLTQDIDASALSKEVISQLKSNMVSAIKNSPNTIERLNAGMTYLYIYYSKENKRLYDIVINQNDLK